MWLVTMKFDMNYMKLILMAKYHANHTFWNINLGYNKKIKEDNYGHDTSLFFVFLSYSVSQFNISLKAFLVYVDCKFRVKNHKIIK